MLHEPFVLIVYNISKLSHELHVVFTQRPLFDCFDVLPQLTLVPRRGQHGVDMWIGKHEAIAIPCSWYASILR